jgi:hypothetical protein
MERNFCESPSIEKAASASDRGVWESLCRIGLVLIVAGGLALVISLRGVLPPVVTWIAVISSVPILVVGCLIAVVGLALYAMTSQ